MSVGLATATRVGVLVEVDGKTGVDMAVTVPAAVGGLVVELGVRFSKSTGPQFVAKDASAAETMINGVRHFLTGRLISNSTSKWTSNRRTGVFERPNW